MSSLSALENEITQYGEQLDTIDAGLKDNPENLELLKLRDELNEILALLRESLNELKPTQFPKHEASEEQSDLRHDPNHPLRKPVAPVEDIDHTTASLVSYKVNDNVLARWSIDKAWYPARITSVTGSSTAPLYAVKFKIDDSTETVRSKDIRPVTSASATHTVIPSSSAAAGGTKRKVEMTAPLSASSMTPALGDHSSAAANPVTPGVISAAASLYPEHQAFRTDGVAADDVDKAHKGKKIKPRKELEAGKSKWQDFSNKSKFGKTSKRDSMFRTPDGITGRVGFTGSGQAMRKDPARTRHIYQPTEDAD